MPTLLRRRRRFSRLTPAHGLSTMAPAMEMADRYFHWIFEALSPHLKGCVLEIGSGYGVFAEILARNRHEGQVLATDQDPRSIAVLEQRLAPIGKVRVKRLDILDPASVDALAQETQVDVVLSLNVLEHIEDDVLALRHMSRLLKPGGHVIAFVPALETIYGSLDRLAGHFRRYDRETLDQRFRSAGLRPSASRYFNLIGAVGWFVNACLFPQTRLDTKSMNGQIELFDRYVVRALAMIERVLVPPFGQSLIGVGEKV